MKKIIIITLLLFAYFNSKAQNSDEDKLSPPKNSIFNNNRDNTNNNNETTDKPKNSIRIPILSMIRTEFGLQYERSFSPKFSSTVGFGYLSNIDKVEKISSELVYDLSENKTSGRHISKLLSDSKMKSGFYYELSLKYETSGEQKISSFFEFGYKNTNRILTLTNNEVNYINPEYHLACHYLRLSSGFLFYGSGANKIKFTHELSYGIGFKIAKWNKYYFNQNTNLPDDTYIRSNTKESYTYPYLTFRYAIGFGW